MTQMDGPQADVQSYVALLRRQGRFMATVALALLVASFAFVLLQPRVRPASRADVTTATGAYVLPPKNLVQQQLMQAALKGVDPVLSQVMAQLEAPWQDQDVFVTSEAVLSRARELLPEADRVQAKAARVEAQFDAAKRLLTIRVASTDPTVARNYWTAVVTAYDRARQEAIYRSRLKALAALEMSRQTAEQELTAVRKQELERYRSAGIEPGATWDTLQPAWGYTVPAGRAQSPEQTMHQLEAWAAIEGKVTELESRAAELNIQIQATASWQKQVRTLIQADLAVAAQAALHDTSVAEPTVPDIHRVPATRKLLLGVVASVLCAFVLGMVRDAVHTSRGAR
jgi:hypothetical protein